MIVGNILYMILCSNVVTARNAAHDIWFGKDIFPFQPAVEKWTMMIAHSILGDVGSATVILELGG